MARLLLCPGVVHRVAFYSHDTFGLGHLSRSLKLATSIAPRLGEVEGLLITGSAWTGLFTPPAGFRFVSLPPVVKCGDHYRARYGRIPLAAVMAARRRRITATVETFRPHLWVVDNVPCGLGGEVLPALRAAKQRPGTRAVLALRDVLDRVESITEEWARAGADEALETLYDEIWVFGGPGDVRRLTAQGPLRGVAEKVIPCGRLGPPRAAALRSGPPRPSPLEAGDGGRPSAARTADGGAPEPRRPRILVTGGGGGDAVRLVATYLEALRVFAPPVASRIVLGPDFPRRHLPELPLGGPSEVSLESFVAGLGELMVGSDVVVAMAGYNTVCEIEASGRPAVLVPRVWPRQEQLIRARELQRRGRVKMLHPARVTPSSLWRAVEECLELPGWPPASLGGGLVAARRAATLVGCGMGGA